MRDSIKGSWNLIEIEASKERLEEMRIRLKAIRVRDIMIQETLKELKVKIERG